MLSSALMGSPFDPRCRSPAPGSSSSFESLLITLLDLYVDGRGFHPAQLNSSETTYIRWKNANVSSNSFQTTGYSRELFGFGLMFAKALCKQTKKTLHSGLVSFSHKKKSIMVVNYLEESGGCGRHDKVLLYSFGLAVNCEGLIDWSFISSPWLAVNAGG